MKVCFLITGLLRNFSKTLYPFLLELQEHMDFDMYIYTSKETMDANYIHFDTQSERQDILENPRCKLFTIDNSVIEGIESYRERERNIFYQWNKLYKCFKSLPETTYDLFIRIRPDIKFVISIHSFLDILKSVKKSTLVIPLGNDRPEKQGINDQLAIGTMDVMMPYCSFYEYLLQKPESPLISETLLHRYLSTLHIPIERIAIPYNLYLSDCIILGIAGDSGAGKSTLLTSLQKIFPFDSSLTLETDRYHKWERSDEHWKSMTHLHPEANHLEKLADDTFHLKLGNTVHTVDYDHCTGKFTAPQALQPKQILLLCGLHSLYKERLRNHMDIRIYIDTEPSLKQYWKVSRDLEKRNQSLQTIIDTMEKRKPDFQQFIEPQREHANLIFQYWYDGQVPSYTEPLDPTKICFNIECKIELLSYISHVLYSFSRSSRKTQRNTIVFCLRQDIEKKELLRFLEKESIQIKSHDDIDESYLGVCQILVLCLLT